MLWGLEEEEGLVWGSDGLGVVDFEVSGEYVDGEGDDGGVVGEEVVEGGSDGGEGVDVDVVGVLEGGEGVGVEGVVGVYEVGEDGWGCEGGGEVVEIVEGGVEGVEGLGEVFEGWRGIWGGECGVGGVERVGNGGVWGRVEGDWGGEEEKEKGGVWV